MSTFTVENQIKAKLSYNSDVTCQPPGHSKCDKIYDTDTTNRRGKLLIFMPKALTFFLYEHLLVENRFGFWASQSLK